MTGEMRTCRLSFVSRRFRRIMASLNPMPAARRVVSALLLVCGIVLVFAGLSSALGFTLIGATASIAAIVALLYAGAVWFGGAPMPLVPAGGGTVTVFDRSLHIATGFAPGVSVLTQFPERLRPEIEVRCRAALRGEYSHFDCEHGGAGVSFEIAPVQTLHGLVLYGVIISGSGERVAGLSISPLTTVA
jgi:hypothetical protein